jgi:peptidoglycan hydrolase CwlO-like protein
LDGVKEMESVKEVDTVKTAMAELQGLLSAQTERIAELEAALNERA